MLLEAARAHDIDLSASWIIGDSDNDVAAGRSAGCKTARLLKSSETGNDKADVVARSLFEATRKILQWEEAIADRRTMDTVQA